MVEASHDGYVRRFGLVHQRQLILAADGRELRGQDLLTLAGPPPPLASRSPSRSASTSHPDVEVGDHRRRPGRPAQDPRPDASGSSAAGAGGSPSRTASGSTATAGLRETSQLVVAGESPADGTAIAWIFRRAG